MRIIVYFKLKAGASITDYENWAKTRDIPGVNAEVRDDTIGTFTRKGPQYPLPQPLFLAGTGDNDGLA